MANEKTVVSGVILEEWDGLKPFELEVFNHRDVVAVFDTHAMNQATKDLMSIHNEIFDTIAKGSGGNVESLANTMRTAVFQIDEHASEYAIEYGFHSELPVLIRTFEPDSKGNFNSTEYNLHPTKVAGLFVGSARSGNDFTCGVFAVDGRELAAIAEMSVVGAEVSEVHDGVVVSKNVRDSEYGKIYAEEKSKPYIYAQTDTLLDNPVPQKELVSYLGRSTTGNEYSLAVTDTDGSIRPALTVSIPDMDDAKPIDGTVLKECIAKEYKQSHMDADLCYLLGTAYEIRSHLAKKEEIPDFVDQSRNDTMVDIVNSLSKAQAEAHELTQGMHMPSNGPKGHDDSMVAELDLSDVFDRKNGKSKNDVLSK